MPKCHHRGYKTKVLMIVEQGNKKQNRKKKKKKKKKKTRVNRQKEKEKENIKQLTVHINMLQLCKTLQYYNMP